MGSGKVAIYFLPGTPEDAGGDEYGSMWVFPV